MLSPNDVIAHQLQMGANLFKMFTSDLSDEEYLFQPTEGGCHLLWILGHLAHTQEWALTNLAGQPSRMPKEMQELFSGGSTVYGDASRYPSPTEVQDLFAGTQERMLAALAAFDTARWSDPSPEGIPHEFFPTLGSMWEMLAVHTFWHFGQLTVNRRMMGKPPKLF
jgi:hypothetical protein